MICHTIDPKIKVRFTGFYGDRISKVIDRWLLTVPEANPGITAMFRERDAVPLRRLLPWSGEFAGKHLTAATEVLHVSGSADLSDTLQIFVSELASCQQEDGYLGPWPEPYHLTNRGPDNEGTWDSWGHYHAMTGALLFYTETGERAGLNLAERIASLFLRKYPVGGKPKLVETGYSEMNLAPVHSMALLHRITGKKAYLDFAEELVQQFSGYEIPEDGGEPIPAGNYLEGALSGKEFYQLPKPRWESLHPVMGLGELYRITGNTRYREAVEHIWRSISRYDRHNTGGFSSGEKATGDPYDPRPIETCCTVAWYALSAEVLRITRDPAVADELELTAINGGLGSIHPSGRWSTYNTPMDGVRRSSLQEIVFQAAEGTPELNCCSVNAPRVLGITGSWAFLREEEAVYLNWYGDASYRAEMGRGKSITIDVSGGYPVHGDIQIRIAYEGDAPLDLRLRIPSWSGSTVLRVNGKEAGQAVPGTYYPVAVNGGRTDIRLGMEMKLRVLRRETLYSLYRGPVLLAFDSSWNRDLSRLDDSAGAPSPSTAAFPIREKKQPFNEVGYLPEIDLEEGFHFSEGDGFNALLIGEGKTAHGKKVVLCDFASAGTSGGIYRSWIQ